jgi:FlaA1/EpsC-like NDP-sugar epimerase
MIELNIFPGLENNILGTLSCAEAAIAANVETFVLISTDKAVRPTNIMGATKRFSELILQSLSQESIESKVKFSMVRFGNVLGSSGSVIPVFEKQIKSGGPVTVTDKEVIRYFMTIPEAAQLVIQAGAMSKSCQVFILDMGQSVKIKDLIYKIIKLSGLTIKDDKNLEGDIEIKITGLRPGEKLYEELLIGNNSQNTFHEKIQKAQDPFILFNKLKIDLDNLSYLLDENRVEDVKDLLSKLVTSYESNSKIVDHIYEEQLRSKEHLKSSSIVNNQEDNVVRIKLK